MSYRKGIITLSLIIISITGCTSTGDKEGHHTPGIKNIITGGPVVPREANKIYIRPSSREGDISGISGIFITMLKSKLSMDGRLAVVAEQKIADLVLQYSISRYQIQVTAFGDFGRPVKKRMRIVAGIKLIDAVKDRVILIDREIQSFREYSDVIPPIETETQVLNNVLDNLANRVYSKTVSGWYTHYMTRIEKGKK